MSDREHIAEQAKEYTRPAQDMDAQTQMMIQLSGMPRYLQGLHEIRTGMRRIKNTMKPCTSTDCSTTCLGKEPHNRMVLEKLERPYEEAAACFEGLFEAVVDMIVEYEACTCPFCTAKDEEEDSLF